MSRDATRYWLSRTLPAFGLGILGTYVVCGVGWQTSSGVQRAVFGLGAACVIAGLVIDLVRRREPGA